MSETNREDSNGKSSEDPLEFYIFRLSDLPANLSFGGVNPDQKRPSLWDGGVELVQVFYQLRVNNRIRGCAFTSVRVN